MEHLAKLVYSPWTFRLPRNLFVTLCVMGFVGTSLVLHVWSPWPCLRSLHVLQRVLRSAFNSSQRDIEIPHRTVLMTPSSSMSHKLRVGSPREGKTSVRSGSTAAVADDDEPPSKSVKVASDSGAEKEPETETETQATAAAKGKGKAPASDRGSKALSSGDGEAKGLGTAPKAGSSLSGSSAAAPAGAGAGGGSSSRDGEAPEAAEPEVDGIPNETLFVGNLSYKVSEAVIIKLFTPFGKVVREQFCYHMTGPRRGEPRGFCFVEYSNVEDATKAIRALHGRKLYGRPLRVRFMTVEGSGPTDYSTSTRGGKRMGTGGYGEIDKNGVAKIPSANPSANDAAAGAGVSKLSLDKKVALLKLKLREVGRKSGT